MIEIRIYHDSEDNVKGFWMNGHAKYATYGDDIVCSAVSVLVINTINSIEEFTRDKFDYFVGENGGELRFRFLQQNISDKSQLLLKSMILGLKGIKNEYGNKYLKIKFITDEK